MHNVAAFRWIINVIDASQYHMNSTFVDAFQLTIIFEIVSTIPHTKKNLHYDKQEDASSSTFPFVSCIEWVKCKIKQLKKD